MNTMVSTAGGAPASLDPGEPGASARVGAASSPDVLPPGAKAGPWIVEREIGRGGMGAVYAVTHEEIGKRAALKIVHRRLLTPAFCVERVLLEARVVNAVGHPNIVDIFDTGKLEDGRPYVVMERLEGQALSMRAEASKLLPDQVIAILLPVCDALIAAHAAGVVHRDLKLDNVFLCDNPEDPSCPRVKLVDWGIAKVLHHEVRHTIEGQLVGTPQYLSPEQARGADVSAQSDVYSLGVMAYELFLEQLPFEAETAAEIMAMHLRMAPPAPSEAWPDIPPALEALLLAMLAKRPEARPTVLEVARQLEAVRDAVRGRCERVSAAAITPPRMLRVRSEQGFAPTQPATWSAAPGSRWQVVIGALALAGSLTMFLVTRTGDTPTASAAAHPPADPARIAPLAPPLAAAPADLERVVSTAITRAAAALPPAPPAPATATRPAPRSRVGPTGTASRTITRTDGALAGALRPAPAAPRRLAGRLDPDGTIDPYR